MRRKITVELTDAQFSALAGAVADAEALDQDRFDTAEYRRATRAREAAWAKINAAWYARERQPARRNGR